MILRLKPLGIFNSLVFLSYDEITNLLTYGTDRYPIESPLSIHDDFIFKNKTDEEILNYIGYNMILDTNPYIPE